jgi:outer membrane murein-binding lipoprotein Lpp
MKKIIVLMAALLAVSLFSGCSQKDDKIQIPTQTIVEVIKSVK